MKECATKAQRPLYLKAQKKTKKPTPMQEQTTQTKKRKKTGETRKPHPERPSEESKRREGNRKRKNGFRDFPQKGASSPRKKGHGAQGRNALQKKLAKAEPGSVAARKGGREETTRKETTTTRSVSSSGVAE